MKFSEYYLNQLGNIARGRSRHRPRDAAFLYGGPYPFIQTGDIRRANLYLSDFDQTYSEAGLEQSRLWPAGTLCITIAANIAETAILGIDACFPDSVIGFTADPEKSDVKFVKYLFDADLKYKYRSFTQGAAQDNLSQEKLLSIKFSVPDVVVQRRISTILSSYDDLIENNQRRIALLEESARLLYREWFVHFRFPGHEHVKIIDGLPQGWEKKRLVDCVTFQSGGTPRKSKSEYWSGDVPWISSGELTTMRVSTSQYRVTDEAVRDGSRYAEKDTILAVVRGMSLAKEFRIGIVSRRVCFNQDVKAFVPDRGIPGLFVFHALSDQKEQIRQRAGQASHGTKKLETSILEDVSIIVPSSMLLEHFTDLVRSMHDQWDCLFSQNQKLAQARDLLLPRLMSGEISV
ncbi:type I restriction enzyme S subunit [Azospirillum brasilense]|nr:type I restriction enzyme S subunit [Azospirillum brasilense]